MLNSCWRVWVRGGEGAVVEEGGGMEEVETLQWTTTLSHRWPSRLIHSPCLVLSLSLPWFGLLSLRVLPFGFSLFILFPSLSFSFFFLFLSSASILPARPRACSHFRWELKRVVTRWCAWVFCLCVGSLNSATRELLHILIFSAQNLFLAKTTPIMTYRLIFLNKKACQQVTVRVTKHQQFLFSRHPADTQSELEHYSANTNNHDNLI